MHIFYTIHCRFINFVFRLLDLDTQIQNITPIINERVQIAALFHRKMLQTNSHMTLKSSTLRFKLLCGVMVWWIVPVEFCSPPHRGNVGEYLRVIIINKRANFTNLLHLYAINTQQVRFILGKAITALYTSWLILCLYVTTQCA